MTPFQSWGRHLRIRKPSPGGERLTSCIHPENFCLARRRGRYRCGVRRSVRPVRCAPAPPPTRAPHIDQVSRAHCLLGPRQSREDEYDQFEMQLAAAKAEAELKAGESTKAKEAAEAEGDFLKKNADIARCDIPCHPK